MATTHGWVIEFYLEDDGSSPVEEFLDGLDEKTQARFIWSIEQLRIRNVMAREPLVKHIGGKLYELREESRANIYRIVYFFFTGRRIVLVHGFHKKTQKIPRDELAMADKRLHRFMQRAGGKA